MLTQQNLINFIQSGTLISSNGHKLLMGWGKKTWYQSPPADASPIFYFPDFFLTDPAPWLTHEYTEEIEIDALFDLLSSQTAECPQLHWNNDYKDFFYDHHGRLQTIFKSGKLSKAVLYVMEKCPQAMSTAQLVTSLLSCLSNKKKFHGHLYGTWTESDGILGMTPEVLFTLRKNSDEWTILTHALAGTSTKDDMLSDTKMLHEHHLVIQGIKKSLQYFGPVVVGPFKTLKLVHFSHLIASLQVDIPHRPAFHQIVQALHPTPALGTYPKQVGWDWLHSYQLLIDRRRYGAPVGYIKPEENESSCYVAIRNVQWTPNQMLIPAGCGIVVESDPDEEWNEIELKIKSIKDMLNL